MPRKVIIDCDPGIDDAVAIVVGVGTAILVALGYGVVRYRRRHLHRGVPGA